MCESSAIKLNNTFYWFISLDKAHSEMYSLKSHPTQQQCGYMYARTHTHTQYHTRNSPEFEIEKKMSEPVRARETFQLFLSNSVHTFRFSCSAYMCTYAVRFVLVYNNLIGEPDHSHFLSPSKSHFSPYLSFTVYCLQFFLIFSHYIYRISVNFFFDHTNR